MDEERRKDDVQLEVLTERVNNWMDTTEGYRRTLCSKLDVITDKMNNLPCNVRIEKTKNIQFQLKALWAVTGGMVLAIISEWVHWK